MALAAWARTAVATVRCLTANVPVEVPGIVFEKVDLSPLRTAMARTWVLTAHDTIVPAAKQRRFAGNIEIGRIGQERTAFGARLAVLGEQLQREQGLRTQKHITLDEIGRQLVELMDPVDAGIGQRVARLQEALAPRKRAKGADMERKIGRAHV